MDSVAVIRRLRFTWMVLGMDWPQKYKKYARIHCIIWTLLAIWFPLHLNIFIASSKSPAEIFQNLVMNVAAISCSIKHFFFRYKRCDMNHINECFAQLDKRVQHAEECKYLRDSMLNVSQRILLFFKISYYAVNVFSVVSLIMSGRRDLLIPGWMPFDWSANLYRYFVALNLQLVMLVLATTLNLFNDCYGPLLLCTFAGHVHLLQMRITRIGYDYEISAYEHAEELKYCIKDYQLLLSTYKIIEKTLSLAIFTQFIASSINLCGAVVYIMFYSTNIYRTAFFFVHLIAIALQLLPACYYGSLLQLKFKELTHAIFCCNWLEQQKTFKNNMIILTELTMRDVTPYAAGMVRIHLGSYFATLKMAYSLVTLIISMKST